MIATLKVKLGLGFMGNAQMVGYEFDLSLLAIALFLVLNGSYLWSLDSLFYQDEIIHLVVKQQ